MNRIETLTTLQRRQLYELCWKYEESWLQGKPWPRESWLEHAKDLPPEVVIAELTETTTELEGQGSLKRETVVLPQHDRYEFIDEIARGGAAVVWRVFDRHLQRHAAVKYLLDSRDNREMRIRLQREARCARS